MIDRTKVETPGWRTITGHSWSRVLFDAQDDIDRLLEQLITAIESTLQQRVEQIKLFSIGWLLKWTRRARREN